MSDARKKVFQATSGDWDPVVRSLLTEYEESEYYPDHPEEHSLLFHKMVVLARSAELYGRFKHASVLFEAAGAWRELLALCLFQADFDALQRYGSQGGRRAELIASHRLAVNEDAFRRSVATNNPRCGGRPFVDDHVMGAKGREMAERPATPDGPLETIDAAQNLVEPAPSDRLPFMQATLELDEDSVATGLVAVQTRTTQPSADQAGDHGKVILGNSSSSDPPKQPAVDDDSSDEESGADPIARVDRTKLASYLGIAGATVT